MSDDGLVVINFTHPLTVVQRAQVEALTGRAVVRVVDVATHIDVDQGVASQAAALADQAGLGADAWQTLPLLVNPPGLAPLSAALLAELHGRMGHFPALIRLRPAGGVVPARYDVVEVLDLQGIRNLAREKHRGTSKK